VPLAYQDADQESLLETVHVQTVGPGCFTVKCHVKQADYCGVVEGGVSR
jgi:hypothetical protein